MENSNIMNPNIELLAKLKYILQPLNEMATLHNHSEFYQKQINSDRYKALTKEKNKKETLILTVAVGLGVFMYLFGIFIKVGASFLMAFIVCLMLATIVAVITYFTYYIGKEAKRKKSETINKNANEQLSLINKRANELINQYGNEVKILPPDYQYYIAAEYIYGCFLNQRATTMAEALNLYEDQIHRWKMENYQQQMVNIQYQQQYTMEAVRRNSAICAGASVANAFINLAGRI